MLIKIIYFGKIILPHMTMNTVMNFAKCKQDITKFDDYSLPNVMMITEIYFAICPSNMTLYPLVARLLTLRKRFATTIQWIDNRFCDSMFLTKSCNFQEE